MWLRKRLCDGEACTCLSLSGNWAVALSPRRVGETIEYTVRDKVKLPASQKLALVTLTNKFEYIVLAVHGDEKGRAIAVQPKVRGQEGRIYLAFRGMRNRGTTEEEDVGARADRRAFKDSSPAHAPWMPDASMRVHRGILDHHASLWISGIATFLGALSSRVQRGLPLDEVLFIGLSMGGALAELTAFRAAQQFPLLIPKIHILSFGSIPWANDTVATVFDETFGRRSVQLVLSRRTLTEEKKHPSFTWWVAEPSARWGLVRSIFMKPPEGSERGTCGIARRVAGGDDDGGGNVCSDCSVNGGGGFGSGNGGGITDSGGGVDDGGDGVAYVVGGHVVFDPLVATSTEHFCPLPNVVVCSQERSTVDARATYRAGATERAHPMSARMALLRHLLQPRTHRWQ